MSPSPPAFLHSDAGTFEPQWGRDHRFDDLRALSASAPLGPGRPERLVVVAAHPDDETLGAGGLIATAGHQGSNVVVVVLTNGEASHPRSPSTTAVQLARLRSAEVRSAVHRLCPTAEVVCADLPDGALTGSVPEAVTLLVELIGEEGATTLLVAPWRGDGHPDHVAAGRAAAVAAERTDAQLLEYPIWLWHWCAPNAAPWPAMRRLDLDPCARLAKREAMALHHTQVEPLSDGAGDEALLGAGMLAHFERDHEIFLVEPLEAGDTAFDVLHESCDDPWSVGSSWYERRKRQVTLAALPEERYRRGLEIGCSVGMLAHDLAGRCDEVVALDRSAVAVDRAGRTLKGLPHVGVERAVVPRDWPDGEFDLVVLSEVGYFLSPAELSGLIDRVRDCLTPAGHVVLCHWRHPITGWPLDGERVHERWAASGAPPLVVHRETDFVLEVFGSGAVDPRRDEAR